jgi:hypothetical protein
MAYNEVHADRVRGVLAAVDGEVTERKMFGRVCGLRR